MGAGFPEGLFYPQSNLNGRDGEGWSLDDCIICRLHHPGSGNAVRQCRSCAGIAVGHAGGQYGARLRRG
ncbi:hypothetical protein C1O51_10065 [Akkermansia muciniphila]|nr:hypothetical protein [Akkermansia sp.]MCO6189408.1 hypothetical protein [Akkermansia muciniphila]PNC43438.1 hypothetical protein CXU08_11045 [Akkermansia muciniphila]PNC53488.1 hypothetical protein CXU06_07780 [Akkermansia muciniphila]PNC74928.1 hypothetical protein CXU02_06650 [Akkermansia muciniphila]